jgi:ketosteroid isomerase-like protein
MSREDVELVRAIHPTGVDLVEFFSEDPAAVAALMEWGPPGAFADNVEVRFISDTPGVEAEYSGLAGFVEGWRDWLEPWATYRVDVEQTLDAGDEVVALLHVRARTKHGDVAMEHSPGSVWTVRDGRVARILLFSDRKQAVKTVGLSENVERICKGYAAFSRGDLDAAVQDFHPDIDWIGWDALSDGGVVRGRDGVREFFRTWREAFDELTVEPEEIIEEGQHLIVQTRVHGRGRESTADITAPLVPWVWTIRDGQVVRMEMFANRAEAFESLGLPEPGTGSAGA